MIERGYDGCKMGLRELEDEGVLCSNFLPDTISESPFSLKSRSASSRTGQGDEIYIGSDSSITGLNRQPPVGRA